MASSLGAKSTSTFDLLDGVDATGGLAFSLRDVSPFPATPVLSPMTDGDIVNRIRDLSRLGSAWWANDPHCRFSLGGHQGKFTAARLGGSWLWPNISLPSTHIFKPEPHDLRYASAVELATMNLAELCGLDTPARGIESFHDRAGDEQCYVIERFDRALSDGITIRLRCEDMLQSMGRSPEDKYDPDAGDCIALLRKVDPSDELAYQWVERLAFNTYVGNSDAHAKNYSLMLAEHIALAPVYDEICTRFWPRYNQELSMPVAGEFFAENVMSQHWEQLAQQNALDPSRVVCIARNMREKVHDGMDEAIAGLDSPIADRLRRTWEKTSQMV
jgi:serine/threonine-protein kinase HipA